MTSRETIILDKPAITRAMTRIAHEILEKNKGTENVVLVGIRRGGDHLARFLQKRIREIEGVEVPMGSIDITMYRDDLGSRSTMPIGKTDILFSLDDKKIVLVDDVLFTGRTIRAALDALIDLGRPRSIQLAVLIDRGHRDLPIRADYVGRNVPTSHSEQITVRFDDQRVPEEVLLAKS